MAHSDPFRLRVMKGLTALFEGIVSEDSNSGDTGFKNDLAGLVFRGRSRYGGDDPVPMISLLETPTPVDQVPGPVSSTATDGDWDIYVQGFAKDDPVNPTDPAYILAADVQRAVALEKRRVAAARRKQDRTAALLGVLMPNGAPAITDIVIGRPICRPPDEISDKAYFWLTLTLKISEDLENPYD